MEVDTGNDQFVGIRGDTVTVLRPKHEMTKLEALRHAAWLVAIADWDDQFASVLTAVRNT